jgi:hypothetical protein
VPHGVNPKTFPLSVREYVECDYIRKLSPSEKEWLAKFNDRYHGAAYPPTDHAKGCGCEDCVERRDSYNRKNAANNDVYAVSRVFGLASSETVIGDRVHDSTELVIADQDADQSTGPEYLRSEEYRAALADLRRLLPRNPRNKLADTPELRAAYARLAAARGFDDDEGEDD